jgi:hypothetical protein
MATGAGAGAEAGARTGTESAEADGAGTSGTDALDGAGTGAGVAGEELSGGVAASFPGIRKDTGERCAGGGGTAGGSPTPIFSDGGGGVATCGAAPDARASVSVFFLNHNAMGTSPLMSGRLATGQRR